MMVMTMLMMTTAMTVCTRRGDMWPAALKATPGAFRLCKKQREPEHNTSKPEIPTEPVSVNL